MILHAGATTIYSQNPESADILNAAYGQYLDFQLDSCLRTISSSPNGPMMRYLEILAENTEIFMSDDREFYKERKSMESEQLDKLSFTEEYNNFLKAEIKLQWAVLKLKYDDEFAAFWGLRQAYNMAKSNIQAHPAFLPSYKTLGLLHVLYGIFPDKYDWILALLGIEGNVDQGLNELNLLYEGNHFLSLEAGITVSMLYAYLLSDPGKAAQVMRPLQAQNKRLLIDYAYALVLMKNSQSAVALNVLENAKQRYPLPFAIPQVYYLLGEINLQRGKLEEAVLNYNRFLALQSGRNMVKDTNYKIGICYLIEGSNKASSYYLDKAKNYDYAKNEADKNAEMEIKSGHFSYKKLYQLRYATDGGYYELAEQIHNSIDPGLLDGANLCEYHYRSARFFHKTGKIADAIENYRMTIELQGENTWYYAPNSALQLGLIYKSRSDYEEAEMFLRSVSNYRDYPYQTSIRQKAKTALNELP